MRADGEAGLHGALAGERPSGWRRSAIGTLGTGSALIAGQAATGIALLILARRTSPRAFGAFIALYGVSTAVGGLIDFGSSKRATRDLAQGARIPQFIPWLQRRTILQIPAVAALTAIALAVGSAELPGLCIAALTIQASTLAYAQGVLAAVRALRSPVMAEWLVCAGNVVILGTVAVAPSAHLLSAAAVASALSWVVCASAAFIAVRSRVLPSTPDHSRNPWRGASSFGVASLAVVLQGFLLVIVERTAGPEAAGSLGAVQKWTQPIGLVAAAYGGYLFPGLAAAVADRGAIRLLKSLIGIVAIGVVACGLVVSLAPQLVRLLLGNEYRDSVHILRLLLVASLPELVVHPLSVLLQARGLDRHVAWTLMALSVGGLAGVAFAAAHLGNAAVPLVDGISYGIAMVVFAILTRRLWLRDGQRTLLVDL